MAETLTVGLIGKVEEIFIAGDAGEKMSSAKSVVAIAGQGLEGDRYQLGKGHIGRSSHVTLIDEADIREANRGEIRFDPAAARRNILTSGLSELFRKFHFELLDVHLAIGEARIHCYAPCLACMVPGPGFSSVFKDRGGVRAAIIEGGRISVGDPIALLPPDEVPKLTGAR